MYQEDIKVEVEGLYFDYKAGPASSDRLMDYVEPNLSKIDFSKAAAGAIASNAANRLLASVPDFGLPIKIKDNSAKVIPNPGDPSKPPKIEIGVIVSVPGFEGASGDATLEISPSTGEAEKLQGDHDSDPATLPAGDDRASTLLGRSRL